MITMRLIINLVVIIIRLIIILMRLIEMPTVIIVIIKAAGVDQAHGAVGGSTVLDSDSGASEKTCRKTTVLLVETRNH